MVFDVQEVLINSNDRTSGTIGNFVIPLAHSHYISEHYTHVALSQIALSTHLYNINPQNNRLFFKVTQVSLTDPNSGPDYDNVQGLGYIDFASGFYENASDINNVLSTQTMNFPTESIFEGVELLGTITYSFNNETKKSTFTYQPLDTVIGNPGYNSDYPNVWPHGVSGDLAYLIQLATFDDFLLFSSEASFNASLNNFIGLHATSSTTSKSVTAEGATIDIVITTLSTAYAFELETTPNSTTLFDIGKSLVLCSDMVQNQMMSSNAVLPGAMALIPYNETGEYLMYEVQYDHNYNIGNQVRHNIHFQIRTTDGYPVDFEGGQIEILLRFKKL